MQPVASLNVLWESYRCIHNMSEIISYQLGGVVNTINGSSGDVTSIAVTNTTNTLSAGGSVTHCGSLGSPAWLDLSDLWAYSASSVELIIIPAAERTV